MAATHLVDRVSRLATNTLEVVVQRSQLLFELEHSLDPREVQAVRR